MSEHNWSDQPPRPADRLPPLRCGADGELDDDLAQRLREGAAANRPEFSESLHARIIGSLPAGAPQANVRMPRAATGQRWLVGSLAAATLVAGIVLGWQLRGPGSPDMESSNDTALAVSDPGLAAMGAVRYAGGAEVGMMIDNTFARSQWAYLDHDARLAADLVMDQLPLELAFSEEK